MGFGFGLWKAKKSASLSRGAIYRTLAEGWPCEAVSRFPQRRFIHALEVAFGADQQAWRFEIDLRPEGVIIAMPSGDSLGQKAALSWFVEFASREKLELFSDDALTDDHSREADAAHRRALASEANDSLDLLNRAAEAGDGSAMNELGNAYAEGEGVPVDGPKALEWYGRAIAAGFNMALFSMAECYRTGIDGVPADGRAALEWYERAFATGCLDALVSMAECYRTGDGVPRDPAKALQTYQRLYEHEKCVSAYALAEMHAAGEGTERSVEKAVELFRIARANKHPGAYVAMRALGFAPLD